MKKKVIIIIIILLIVIVGKNLYLVIRYFKTVEGRLSTNLESTQFDVNSYLKIDKERISSESEVFNLDNFLEYNCKIDSIYTLTIVKVGNISTFKITDSINLNKIDLPYLDRNINMVWTSAHPIDNLPFPSHSPGYNVIELPMKDISKVDFFVDGKIIKSEYDSLRKMVIYDLQAKKTTISFNRIKKTYLSFVTINELVSLFFFVDKNQLYAGFLSSSNENGIVLRQIESSNPQFEPLIFENIF